jgi:hypothetical protein
VSASHHAQRPRRPGAGSQGGPGSVLPQAVVPRGRREARHRLDRPQRPAEPRDPGKDMLAHSDPLPTRIRRRGREGVTTGNQRYPRSPSSFCVRPSWA